VELFNNSNIAFEILNLLRRLMIN